MNDLLHDTLRARPDRIVVGEVRGDEALALLDAWNTGHDGGCSTVHSSSAMLTLRHLEQLVSRVSVTPQQETIAGAVDVIVYLRRKGTLVDKVAEAAGISKKDTKAVVDALISTVTEEVKKDAEIRLIGFGTFKKAQRAARKGRNPQTGEVIDIAASESLAFKSSVKY